MGLEWLQKNWMMVNLVSDALALKTGGPEFSLPKPGEKLDSKRHPCRNGQVEGREREVSGDLLARYGLGGKAPG